MNILSILRKINIFGGPSGGDAAASRENRRKALQAAKAAIALVKDKAAELTRERDASWEEARKSYKAGQRPAARHALTAVHDADVILSQLDSRRWLFEHFLVRIESLETDRSFAQAISAFAKIITVDPDRTSEALREASEKCDVLKDVEKAWNREYRRSENAASSFAAIPSVEDMMKDLESSVSGEKGEKGEKSAKKKDDPPAAERKTVDKTTSTIAEILRNIAKALDGNSK